MKNPTAPLETSMANFHECEWKERALKAEAKLDAVRDLLKLAECPDGECIDGVCGVWKGELPDGNEVWEYYECQWCAERKEALGENDE